MPSMRRAVALLMVALALLQTAPSVIGHGFMAQPTARNWLAHKNPSRNQFGDFSTPQGLSAGCE